LIESIAALLVASKSSCKVFQTVERAFAKSEASVACVFLAGLQQRREVSEGDFVQTIRQGLFCYIIEIYDLLSHRRLAKLFPRTFITAFAGCYLWLQPGSRASRSVRERIRWNVARLGHDKGSGRP